MSTSPTPFLQRADVGPMVSGYMLEMAVEQTLRAWFTAYLCEAERDHGLTAGQTAWPRGWAHSGTDLQKMAPDQLPAFVIMASGITQKPTRSSMPVTLSKGFQLPSGNLAATFGITIASIFSAAWSDSSRRDSQLYAVAARTCLQQRPLSDAFDSTVRVRAEEYDPLDFERTRTYSASVVAFDVMVDDIGWTDGGPPVDATPPDDPTQPPEGWPLINTVQTTVNKHPLDETPIQEDDE